MSQNHLLDEVYPAIYSGYPAVLDAIYLGHGIRANRENRQSYLHSLREPAEDLWHQFRQEGHEARQLDIPIDYSRSGYQEVYLLRYFFPHALLIPTVLDSLLQTDGFFKNIPDRLSTTSFLGGDPGPELYGLMHYLKKDPCQITRIKAAMFDLAPAYWRSGRGIVRNSLLSQIRNPSLYKLLAFKSNLAARGEHFLPPASEQWIEKSDLIVIQCCLNEIAVSKYEQVLMNVEHVMDIMKSSALMLIIERLGYGFGKVKQLLENIESKAKELENIKTHCEQTGIRLTDLNNEHVPEELKSHLFLNKQDRGLTLAGSLDYYYLAISKQ